jgi:hypothetical protein
MKRFFSVAVSVGFASKIGEFRFLSASITEATTDQIHQAILLVFAMVVVVGSWEFYFRSIDKHPLTDMPRFVIDIILVSVYIVLLLSVRNFGNFLLYIDIIMSLYVLWDIFKIKAYPRKFGVRKFTAAEVAKAYLRGFRLEGWPGPSITLWWFAMFLLVSLSHWLFPGEFFFIAVGSAAAYVLYRLDQTKHWMMRRRLVYSAGLVCALFVLLTIDGTI